MKMAYLVKDNFNLGYFNNIINDKDIVIVGNNYKGIYDVNNLRCDYPTVIRFNHAPDWFGYDRTDCIVAAMCKTVVDGINKHKNYVRYFRITKNPIYIINTPTNTNENFCKAAFDGKGLNVQYPPFQMPKNIEPHMWYTTGTCFLIGLRDWIRNKNAVPKSITTIGFTFGDEFKNWTNTAVGTKHHRSKSEPIIRDEIKDELNIKVLN